MNDFPSKITNLKKLTIGINIAPQGNNTPISPNFDAVVSFIYGIGPQGLTPFEYELADKTKNDQFLYTRGDLDPYEAFGHVGIWILPHTKILESSNLVITVLEIEDPSQEELFKALAEVAQCGDHCCSC